MLESLSDAKEELKRVDHLIYVSLKYTRTVDVFLNIITRMIDAYDFLINALLKSALENKLIEQIPASPREKGELVMVVFKDEVVKENINLYFLLRKMLKSNPQREHEYRRNVTMTTYIDNRKEIMNIDIATDYYHFQKAFVDYVEGLITKKP
ncbi:MAG: hypothetical protein KJ583_00530 [Nanoarchaeota archaeon]|nr:hypothetical protein [Nanoarchaeota archaeon]MBU1603775.1 hypothetical protein [Nanoarchaeota archaeon]MBU2443900.1 hypothetical protein [Nanoarchaeota archaeon]